MTRILERISEEQLISLRESSEYARDRLFKTAIKQPTPNYWRRMFSILRDLDLIESELKQREGAR